VVPQGTTLPNAGESSWFSLADVPPLTPRQRALLDAALETIRVRLDQAPIAFRLLPPTFTLSELQQTYELLLGRRLHKASFRRALQAAWLVEPTDEWRSEGRGRPAQLFRYAPRRRRSQRRGVRFDLLSGQRPLRLLRRCVRRTHGPDWARAFCVPTTSCGPVTGNRVDRQRY
jgi:hypothetical protein